jgi:hypothetical protein
MTLRKTALVLSVLVALAACGGATDDPAGPTDTTAPSTSTDGTMMLLGTVIDVDGNLATVKEFTVRSPDGSETTFELADGALFDDGPIAHVRDHLRSGQPVTVEYAITEDGSNLARSLGDASAEQGEQP